jgi:hypothetical protein
MPPPAHLDVDKPGDLVQLDCFHIGRLTGTKGKTARLSPGPIPWVDPPL